MVPRRGERIERDERGQNSERVEEEAEPIDEWPKKDERGPLLPPLYFPLGKNPREKRKPPPKHGW